MLRPYQVEAVQATVSALAAGGVGQLHAACGTGKTLTALWAAERLVPRDGVVAVLAPSLALVAQTLAVWQKSASVPFRPVAVCSDHTVSGAVDELPLHVADLRAPVTTDPAEIARLLASGGRVLVVGTYLSADKLAQAVRETRPLELLICDEAHHLAGRPEFPTRRVVDPGFLPARRRLHLTATPRVDATAERTGALSMDDTEVFGQVLHTYPFPRAIAEGHLEDYRIAVIGVPDSQARGMLAAQDRAYVDTPGGVDLRMRAAQVALARAHTQFGMRRVISFHPKVADAAEFARTLPATLRSLGEQAPEPVSMHVSGQMTHHQRSLALRALADPPEDGWAVVSNARCLSEGVDVPAVDGILFAHPKRSTVDIVQAVGRALRRHPDTPGPSTIIVPLIVPDAGGEIGDLDARDYQTLWDVVRALRAHDEGLGIELDLQRVYEATGEPRLPDKITILLPQGVSERVLAQLTVLLVRQTTGPFWGGYAHAHAFHAEHGHLHVHRDHVTADGFALGSWLHTRRQHRRRGWLPVEHAAALEKLGIEWEPRAARWMTGYAHARAFHAQHGHLRVLGDHVAADGFKLGQWIAERRAERRDATLPADRVAQLDELGMLWKVGHGTVRPDRTLAALRPDLAAQWDPDGNDGLTPDQVSTTVSSSRGWICPNGHRYRTAVKRRIAGAGCPRCRHRPEPGQSLADLHPDIAAQLPPELNDGLEARELRPKSNQRLWWRCPHGHTWQAPVTRRTTRGTGCPHCRRAREKTAARKP